MKLPSDNIFYIKLCAIITNNDKKAMRWIVNLISTNSLLWTVLLRS